MGKFKNWFKLHKKAVLITSAVAAFLLTSLLFWYLYLKPSTNVNVSFYNENGSVAKILKVQKGKKIVDDESNKKLYESLGNKYRWSKEKDVSQQAEDKRVKNFNPYLDVVEEKTNLYPVKLDANSKMLVFHDKKGVRLLPMVVSKGLDAKEVKKQLDQMPKPTYNDWVFKGWYRYSYGGESHLEPYEYGTPEEQEQRKLDNKGQNQLEEDALLHAYLEPKNSKNVNYSEDQTKKIILRQDVPHINMMNSLDGTVNDLGCYLKSSFFVTDIDWNKAIKEGYATYPGDFSQNRKEKHKPGECVPGDENKISTKVLKPMTLPGIIKKLPEHSQLKDANNRNLEGNEYSERSKKVFENSYTFTLKEGLTFENGEPIDASTVEYTLKQYIDPKQKNARAENVFKAEGMDLKDAKGYYEGQITNFNQVTGFKKVENDPYSFTLTYNSEKALYNAMGALDSITLVPPRYYEESFENKAERKNNVYGTPKKPIQSYGPYVIKECSPNQKYVFNKNYNYWNKNKHHNKAISWTIVDKKDIQHSMFKDGTVNTFGLDSNYYSSYSKDPTYKEFPVDNKTSLSINVLDRKDEFKNAKTTAASSILKDLDFRKALFYAIDRQDFVNQVDILSNPSFSFVPDVACVYFDEPFEIPYNSSANHKENQKILTDQMDTYGFDPAKAKTSFDRAYDKWKVNNQKDPKLEMEFIYSNTSEETDKKARYLKNVFENTFGSDKINIKLSSITRETYLRKLQADKYDYELVFSPVQV